MKTVRGFDLTFLWRAIQPEKSSFWFLSHEPIPRETLTLIVGQKNSHTYHPNSSARPKGFFSYLWAVKSLAFIFSLLTILLSVQPSFARTSAENVRQCCSDAACTEEGEDPENPEKESGACNPFQCHTCCFLYLPTFPDFQWLQEPLVLTHFTLHPNETYSLFPPSFWQPPKIS
jgi:hypothetical protein